MLLVGCSPTKYRHEADREVYGTIAERNGDARWNQPKVSIEVDPRSRYFDPHHPDCSPMPPDDPSAHQYMHCVDGKKGWPHWHDNGTRVDVENPDWFAALATYADVDPDGTVRLDMDSALQVAYVHSPLNQTQLETLYLSSLDVTGERFALDVQDFGGFGLAYRHRGDVNPASIQPAGNAWVVNGPTSNLESNRLTTGAINADGGTGSTYRVTRRFATAGDLAVGFANSFVFEFNGSDANLSSSLVNFTLTQPLLRGAGRDIALEPLTQAERNLLGALRGYAQFRQGFYTQVAIGELGVATPQRRGAGTTLNIFSGLAGVNGYVGLLQQLQQIRNAEDNLALQIRTLSQLEDRLASGLIDLVQVDQFRQNVERDRANLLQQRNTYLAALDRFKTGTLGLPPDLLVDLDDTLIRPFQLTDRSATELRNRVTSLQDQLGALPEGASQEQIDAIQEEVFDLLAPMEQLLEDTSQDVETLQGVLPVRVEDLGDQAGEILRQDVNALDVNLREIHLDLAELEASIESLRRNQEQPPEEEGSDSPNSEPAPPDDVEDPPPGQVDETQSESLEATDGEDSLDLLEDPRMLSPEIRETVILLRRMLRLVDGAALIQARARLESVSVDSINLPFREAYRIALQNRLDFMNARAALVDAWRQIQIRIDALQSVLDFSAGGDIRTDRNNPLSFRGGTGTARLGIRFDAPLTRLLERNSYREELINYQRSRRGFIQSRDSLHQGLRILLREIERLKLSLEIQRRAVAIAIRRVDLTTRALEAPVRPPPPGQRPATFGPTAAINLLSAQAALRDTQNAFLNVYISYYAARLRLARELGIMSLDPDGNWIEIPLPGTESSLDNPGEDGGDMMDVDDLEEIPPPLPEQLIDAINAAPVDIPRGIADPGVARGVDIINAPILTLE